MQLHTAQHAKELQRQVGVRESRRLDATADGTLGKGNTGLTDDAVRKHREARQKRNRTFWRRKARKVQTRSRPEVVAVDPGTTVLMETSAWEPELGTALRGHGCRRVDDSALVDIINIWVTRDLAKPCGKTVLVLAWRVVWSCPRMVASPPRDSRRIPAGTAIAPLHIRVGGMRSHTS